MSNRDVEVRRRKEKKEFRHFLGNLLVASPSEAITCSPPASGAAKRKGLHGGCIEPCL